MTLQAPAPCSDPARRDSQVMVRREVGWVFGDRPYVVAGGITWADFDGDGALELLRTTENGLQYWEVEGELWTEVGGRFRGMPTEQVSIATAADFDGDGDLDLFVGHFHAPDRLLRNDGSGHFEDVTEGSGLLGASRRNQTGSWGDLDGDGDLDLFVGNYGDALEADPDVEIDPSELYLNRGDGTFEDVTLWLTDEVHDGYNFMSAIQDIDDDGQQDLWVANDFSLLHEANQLYLGQGDDLERDPTLPIGGVELAGMGTAIADLNDDGLPDFVITSLYETGVLLAAPAKDTPTGLRWTRYDAAWGLDSEPLPGTRNSFGWGTAVADLDLDGSDEILVAWGDFLDPLQERDHRNIEHDEVWRKDERGRWVNEASRWRMNEGGASRGLLAVDYNRDGWMDVTTAVLEGPTVVYTGQCGDSGHFLGITVRDETTPNTYGIGATVRVTTAAGRVRTRWITAGSTSMYAGEPAEAHVGFGDSEALHKVEITFPDGEVMMVDEARLDHWVHVTRTAG